MAADWAKIRADYEAGESLRQLAAKYQMSKSVIGQRKFSEQWQRSDNGADMRTDTKNQAYITRDVNAAVRVQRAIKLYLEERPTWDEIAARCGYGSRSAAWIAVQRELHRCITHDVKDLRTEDLYMLSQIQARCYKAAIDENNKGWTWAVDRFVTVSKRKAELMGLDIPVEDGANSNLLVIREVPVGWLVQPAQEVMP